MLLNDEVDYTNVSRDIILAEQSLLGPRSRCQFSPNHSLQLMLPYESPQPGG